jgi:hypothetical protein
MYKLCTLKIGDIPNSMTMWGCGTIYFFYGVCFSHEVINIYILMDLIQNHEGMLISWICVVVGIEMIPLCQIFMYMVQLGLRIFVKVVICVTNFVDWEMHGGTMRQISFDKG